VPLCVSFLSGRKEKKKLCKPDASTHVLRRSWSIGPSPIRRRKRGGTERSANGPLLCYGAGSMRLRSMARSREGGRNGWVANWILPSSPAAPIVAAGLLGHQM